MKVAVICEFTGIVREAFKNQGHDAISFDLSDTEIPGKHEKGNILDFSYDYWNQFDLAICFPPCTNLSFAGVRHFKNKAAVIEKDLNLVKWLMDLPVKKIAIENPMGLIHTKIRKCDQIINPYEFGHYEKKRTCLWFKNLPPLMATELVHPDLQKEYVLSCTTNRAKNRSRTFSGIALAMADQWGYIL
jgi:site-specific DNA-cytosine methylase